MKIQLHYWLGAAALAFFIGYIPNLGSQPIEQPSVDGQQTEINEWVLQTEQAALDAYYNMSDAERMKGPVYE